MVIFVNLVHKSGIATTLNVFRQQRHLISLLARLELKEAPFKSLDVLPSPRGAPMRVTAPLHSHISGAWKGSDTQESDPPAEQSFDKVSVSRRISNASTCEIPQSLERCGLNLEKKPVSKRSFPLGFAKVMACLQDNN